MALPVLPAKYYLSHFYELIDFLVQNYEPVFEENHFKFVDDFRSLSEDSQCAYVRMVNRKGSIFPRAMFNKYQEIDDIQGALLELQDQNFIAPLSEDDKQSLLNFLPKAQLTKWLNESGFTVKSTLSRDELRQISKDQLRNLDILRVPDFNDLIAQRRSDELDYLLYLYFGKIQKGLNLYALRDLGIRRETKFRDKFKARFTSLEHSKADYYFSKKLAILDEVNSIDELKSLIVECRQIPTLRATSRGLKNQLLLQVAEILEADNVESSLDALSQCSMHPSRERRCRLLLKLDRKDECRQLLEEIIENPYSDEELLFAEDFLMRKFEKKKIGYLTDALNSAREISLSDMYFKRPEKGVRDLYRAQGIEAHFTENYLWNGLFGLLFWDELFESEQSAIFNPFERSPTDLVGPEFYQTHHETIEKKLALLKEPKLVELFILKMFSTHHGKLNDIFRWHPNLVLMVTAFIRASQDKRLDHVLRTMARNYENHSSGYPDLMVIDKGFARFIEVKAEGDNLRAQQLSKVRLLSEAGYEVEILKVRWQVDPNQVYVVVDVETTGGSAQFHKVTEIGAVKIQNGQVIDEFQTLINPGRPIPKNITMITGITDEMVADAPKFAEVAEAFLEFTKNSIFVAHNAKFDYSFIQKEYQRLGMDFIRPQMCTVLGMRKNFPGLASYSLKNLTTHFQISLEQHHRALCDAKAAAELLLMINGKRAPNEIHYHPDEHSSEFPKDL